MSIAEGLDKLAKRVHVYSSAHVPFLVGVASITNFRYLCARDYCIIGNDGQQESVKIYS